MRGDLAVGEDDVDAGEGRAHGGEVLDGVGAERVGVDDGDLGPAQRAELDQAVEAGGLAHDLEVGAAVEKRGERLTQQPAMRMYGDSNSGSRCTVHGDQASAAGVSSSATNLTPCLRVVQG